MRLRNKITSATLLLMLALLVGCEKESDNIFNMFDVKLTLHNNVEYAAAEVNDITTTDSVLIDFTIESPTKDMYMVCLYKTGATSPMTKIPITEDGKRKSYSGKFMLYGKDLGAGTSTYRVWVLDKEGVYLGDGYKSVAVNVISDIRHLSNRKLTFAYAPTDTVPCFLSLLEGKIYNYPQGAANSAKLDFSVFEEPVFTNGVFTGWKRSMYSLTANPNPFPPYDLTGWTKRATLYSAPITGSAANFRTMFSTAAKIETEAKKKPINLTLTEIKTNQFVYFLTPEGKYGVLYIQSITYDYSGRSYVTLSYKIQN
ncbi:MAG TPA: hypothetical protein VLC98_16985 [Phnomibacter sp.]|nr:hypothetical protein [Phnomibacter sp.]